MSVQTGGCVSNFQVWTVSTVGEGDCGRAVLLTTVNFLTLGLGQHAKVHIKQRTKIPHPGRCRHPYGVQSRYAGFLTITGAAGRLGLFERVGDVFGAN